MPIIRNKWQGGTVFVLALLAATMLIWWLNEPVATLLRMASDLRTWIVGFGPLAPLAYTLFYAAQILIAPLPGNLLSVMAGYVFGFGVGLLLSLIGLTLGACLAVVIARKFGRPLLARFFSPAELVRWERKFRLRSPLVWYVLFLFPVPDLVMYAAGLGTLRLRLLLPAILLGRATGILIGAFAGNATAVLPAQFVIVQWLLLLALAALVYRFQRPVRYHLLVGVRRLRRVGRPGSRNLVPAPVEAAAPLE